MTDNLESKKINNLKIGSIELKSRVMTAPMAGITDTVLRQMVRIHSKNSLLVSEMLSSEAIKMNPDKSMLKHVEEEKPLSFQISGHKPELMAEAARMIEPISTFIDINMGCPAPKIVRNNDGSKLMTTPDLASAIIKAVKKAVKVPVTVKFRLGWDCSSKNYVDFAKMAEDSGADAICIHARTRSQQYSGIADWQALSAAKEVVNIPVIANGDVDSPEAALKCLELSCCDAVAVGRGILGDPGLIYRIEHYLETGELLQKPDIAESLDLALLHTKKEAELRGELHGVKFMRKFFPHYIKQIRDASKYRFDLVQTTSIDQVKDIFDKIKNSL